MKNTIINLFTASGGDLQYIKTEKKQNSYIYYFIYNNFNSINKLNLIIKSLKVLINNNNIIASFENQVLKIEIENINNNILYFENYYNKIEKNKNYIMLGINNDNEIYYKKLNDIKSLLIGGSSGSGKSNFLHQIILSSLLLNHNIYYLMIDLKATELTRYNYILKNNNRLIKKVSTNKKDALKTIILFYQIIKSRFKTMKRKKQRQSNEAPVVLIIDEYAQLFNDNKEKKIINDYISKCGAIGRACNCYLFLATQHPTNENINNTIRANLQSRVALKCANSQQSKNILNKTGAENITKAGDLICWIDACEPVKLKSCFISDNFLNIIENENK